MKYPNSSPTHYLIGLTGNIGTGKSLVRKLLERMGALGIDADELTRQASMQGAPAFAAIRARFGESILDAQGEIDRKKLGSIVFSDAAALRDLEAILHPQVSRATAALVERSPLPVVVIEAIKLFESDLAAQCRSIWMVDADEKTVFDRLQRLRGMNRAEAGQRLANQSAAAEKLRRADVVIQNSGSIFETWGQVRSVWLGLKNLPTPPEGFNDIRRELAILDPVEEYLDVFRNFMRRHAHSLPAAFLQDCFGLPAHDADWFENRDLALQSLARFYISLPGDGNMAVWDIERFTCAIGAYHCSSAKQAGWLLSRIEDFARYHLCHSYKLQADERDADLLRALGYLETNPARPRSAEGKKAGYNLFNKSCPAALQLFRDMNGRSHG